MCSRSRLWWRAIALLVMSAVGVLVYDWVSTFLWLGSTDLEITILVYDAATEQPIPGAKIKVNVMDSRDEQDREFILVTDAIGRATKERECTCCGTRSGLKFTDTFSVHLPDWTYQVTAPGYFWSGPQPLYLMEEAGRAERNGPGKSTLLVKVPLKKRAEQ